MASYSTFEEYAAFNKRFGWSWDKLKQHWNIQKGLRNRYMSIPDTPIEETTFSDPVTDGLVEAELGSVGEGTALLGAVGAAGAGAASSSIIPPIAVGVGTAAAATLAAIYGNKEEDTPPITLPDHKFLGPGNPAISALTPKDTDDEIAREHDLAYHEAINEENIKTADRHGISDFVSDVIENKNPHSAIGAIGLGVKHAVESVIGVQYPSLPQPGTSEESMVHIPGIMTPPSAKRQHMDDDYVSSSTDTTAAGSVGSASSGGFGEDMGPETVVASPHSSTNPGNLHFNKVHRFTSKGVPFTPKVEVVDPLTADDIIMITSLAHIPWDKPFFYMTPGEFASLPPGAFAKSCKLRVVLRNPQIGFETGGSTSETATLNHNKHFISAIGLSDKVYGTTRKVAFLTPSTPMIPTGTTTLLGESDLSIAMYGHSNAVTAFDTTVPASLFGNDIELDNYYCLWNFSKAFADSTATSFNVGWSSLIEHVTETNMNDLIGHEILSTSYNFVSAPLSPVLPAAAPLTKVTQSFQTGSHTKTMYRTTLTGLPVTIPALTVETEAETASTAANYAIGTYQGIMERCPFNRIIDKTGKEFPDHQPSVHIGMKPIPKISGIITNKQATDWTTVNVFYEVQCSLEIGFAMPSTYSHARVHHIHEGSTPLGVAGVANPTLPNRFGHIGI